MISALLALLVPPAPAEGGGTEIAQAQTDDTGGAFAQLLAQHQVQPGQKQPANQPFALALPKNGSQPIVLAAMQTDAVAPQEISPVSQNAEENPLVALRLLAAAKAEIRPPVPGEAMPKDEGEAEALPATQSLPEIDPTSAFSLIPTPIAYTTEMETAAVVVAEDVALLAQMPSIPEPKAAFTLLSDLAPAAGSQRLNLNPVEIPPKQAVLTAPVEEAALASLPEIALPRQPQAQEEGQDSTTAQVKAPSGALEQKAVLEAMQEIPPQEQTQSEEDAQDAPVVAQGGPFVAIEATMDTEDMGQAPAPQAALPNKPETPASHQPSGTGAPSQNATDPGNQQSNSGQDTAGQQDKALSLPPAAPKPEAAVKPDASKAEDFAALLSDKTNTQSAPAPIMQHAQPQDMAKDVPLVKFSHAQPHLPLEEQVSVHIKQAVAEGVDEVNIKLNPPELGKLHIKMEVAQDGRAHVVVTADSKDTFDLLRSDARGLQQALSDAGVKTDSGSLQFNLREQPGQQAMAQFEFNQQQHNGSSGQQAGQAGEGDENSLIASAEKGEVALSLHQQEGEHVLSVTRGVDIHV